MKNKGAVLLFGAFNPFTNAHLLLGHLAETECPGYDIVYVPARLAYFQVWKGQDTADVIPDELRLQMVRSAAEPEGFLVSDAEISGRLNGRTWNTVQYFRETLGYTDIILCMGTDKVPELETWYRGRELIAENRFLIVTRGGSTLETCMTDYTRQHAEIFREIQNRDLCDLSATAVREELSAGNMDFVQNNVPAPVFETLLALRQDGGLNS